MSHSTRGCCADEALDLVASDISSPDGEGLKGGGEVKHLIYSFILGHKRRQQEPFTGISYSFLP